MSKSDPEIPLETSNLRRAVIRGTRWHLRRDDKTSACGHSLPRGLGRPAILIPAADRCKRCHGWPDYNPKPHVFEWRKPTGGFTA